MNSIDDIGLNREFLLINERACGEHSGHGRHSRGCSYNFILNWHLLSTYYVPIVWKSFISNKPHNKPVKNICYRRGRWQTPRCSFSCSSHQKTRGSVWVGIWVRLQVQCLNHCTALLSPYGQLLAVLELEARISGDFKNHLCQGFSVHFIIQVPLGTHKNLTPSFNEFQNQNNLNIIIQNIKAKGQTFQHFDF